MKNNFLFVLIFVVISSNYCLAINSKKNKENWVNHALEISKSQLLQTACDLASSTLIPRSTWTYHNDSFLTNQLEHEIQKSDDPLEIYSIAEKLGKRRDCDIYDWTSGFFPGSLWYTYELTGCLELKKQAVRYTNMLYSARKSKGTHDLGFMINCSYGNALRLTSNDTICSVLIDAAETLCKRFNPTIGCIRSWDFGSWNYPVIIDNMMNLDLLFNVSKLTGNMKYYNIAVQHAKTTMKNHFRPDHTSYHLVSYNNDGTVETKQTHQGKNDESFWARGQAWGAYGFTLCYRETKDPTFLNEAVAIAEMIMEQVKTKDHIPYWDYKAPVTNFTPRDASAACVTASALLELSTFLPNGLKYYKYAENLLKELSSEKYLAKRGENQGFVLMHSTGSLPHGSEVDTPINYADYYYLEALKRYLDIDNRRLR